MVELGEVQKAVKKEYVKNPPKYVMIPAHGRQRHLIVEKRLTELKKWAEDTKLNRMEIKDKAFGIITGGICYQYVKEAFPEASILKLGMSYPLPEEMIRKFASQVGQLFIVEELEPFWEEEIKNMGLEVKGKLIFPKTGELSAAMISESISMDLGLEHVVVEKIATTNLPITPPRPPVLCPGCPHRAVFHVLKKLKLTVSGDIGCYTLGSLPPLEAIDTTICMGASIGAALGMEKGNPDLAGKVVAVIGDSTFFHSGITGLVDMVYNKSKGTVMILDNSTTAMTGHQEHPATGKTLMEEPATAIQIGDLVRSLGIRRVVEIDPFEMAKLEAVLKEEISTPEVSVIIAKRPCALLEKPTGLSASIDKDKCINCKQCLAIGCPAIASKNGQVTLNESICTGCNLCVQTCKVKAIRKAGDNNE
jgi:indolepyruvate ferredoxin oxidoreductase alpha subunit